MPLKTNYLDSKKRSSLDQEDSSSESEEQELVTSFQSYVAEGDILAKMGELQKAIIAYTKALKMRPGEKNALVARAKCHLLLGDPGSALQDSDQALTTDPKFFKAIYQKAESLYAKGDFEMALVYFHRGQSQRPEFDDFRLGIQNCREAIDNSVGNPKVCKFKPLPGAKLVITIPPTKPGTNSTTGSAAPVPVTEWVLLKSDQNAAKGLIVTKEPHVASNERKTKQLLGELYTDKEYLSKLLNDKDFVEHPNPKISHIAQEALQYLEKRTEFWRQQKPRKREVKKKMTLIPSSCYPIQPVHDIKKQDPPSLDKKAPPIVKKIIPKPTASKPIKKPFLDSPKTPSHSAATQQSKLVSNLFASIHAAMSKRDYDVALKSAKNLLARLTELRDLPDKNRVSIDIFHDLGKIYLFLNNPSEALMYFRKEYALAKDCRCMDLVSRSLSEIGRIQIKSKKYKEAIQSFEEKLSLTKELSLEKVWLTHDLGRCFLELRNYAKALEYGDKSVSLATHLKDNRWTMNAQLLVAQTQGRKKEFKMALTLFQGALEHANQLQDDMAIKAIQRAMNEIQVFVNEK